MKSKKLTGVVFSDLHACKPRLPDTPFSIISQIAGVCESVKADFVLFAGDLLDTRAKIHVLVYNRLLRSIQEFYQRTHLKIYAITGNHDLATSAGGVEQSSLLPLHEMWAEFSVVANGSPVEVCGGVIVHGFGYDLSTKDLNNQIIPYSRIHCADKLVNIGLFHQVTSGSETSAGWRFGEGLDAELLADVFDFSIVGDVHQPQLVSPTVLVPGAPYQMDFSDSGTRGCWVLHIDGGTVSADLVALDYPHFKTVLVNSPAKLKSAKESFLSTPGTFFRLKYPAAMAALVASVPLPPNVSPAELPEENGTVRVQLGGGDKGVLSGYVDYANPTISPERKAALLEEGMRLLSNEPLDFPEWALLMVKESGQ